VQTEYVAACEFLDEEYPILPASSPHDNNTYTFGRIGHHNVVIACLPKDKYGLTSAASVAKDMLRSFPSIRFGMMVGIGGGAPSLKHDIRLGDVVVSSPVGRTGGVVHYEIGKTIQNQKFERTGALDAPPPMLLTALSVIGALHERKGHQIGELVSGMVSRNPRLRKKYQCPKPGTDLLYESSFIHPDRDQACDKVCSAETARLVRRNERTADEDNPKVHYGLIASADRLMEDAQVRDTLARDEEVLCFEMEAAGLVDHFPCVVIRGICDYSDTHKNDIWQGYAAATAAAYAKELLHVIPVVGRQLLSQFPLVPTVSAPKYSLGLNLCSAPLIEEGTFVGRAVEMKQLQEWLCPRTMPPTQNIVTIVGLGGLGKTQLSLEFAKQYHASYSTVFWLNAKDEITLKQSFRVVWQIIFGTVQSCSVENHTVEDQEVQQIRQWLSQHDNCKWLLLFDNYDDPRLPGVRSSIGYDIRQYFPYKSQGSILITTRSHRLTFARSLQLQKLNDLAQSLAILSNRSCRNIGGGKTTKPSI
jgi:nucleoside phosphorylase